MRVVCTNGMTIDCDSFRAIDSGVLLFDESEDDDDRETIGFVPITELQYVLPESAHRGSAGGQQLPQRGAGHGWTGGGGAQGGPPQGGRPQGQGQPGSGRQPGPDQQR